MLQVSAGDIREACSWHSRTHLTMEMPLEPALSWLRRELSEMRQQDQRLMAQLNDLHSRIREHRLEAAFWASRHPIQESQPVRGRSTSEDMGTAAHKDGDSPTALQISLRRNSAP
ncbi:PREDICTED: uncharacterized protein C20orf202 homolog [Nanorana parkeri]|uniref:uncharacterized protein C20orf202 homolog n=1 Tax=Nanorana parkeri TaxID=125878 RepID=UPI0008541685|nr:PREDICTED: uncharacterized protein C20orf202 homolog [Nanorana parkeri]